MKYAKCVFNNGLGNAKDRTYTEKQYTFRVGDNLTLEQLEGATVAVWTSNNLQICKVVSTIDTEDHNISEKELEALEVATQYVIDVIDISSEVQRQLNKTRLRVLQKELEKELERVDRENTLNEVAKVSDKAKKIVDEMKSLGLV